MARGIRTIAWNLLGEHLFGLSLPQHLYIEPTDDCNLHCSICPHQASKKEAGYLDLALFKKIIQEARLCEGLESITLHKQGEPLLHPEFAQMIKYIKKHLPAVEVSFSTNGMLLSNTIAQKILEAMPDQIFISFGNLLVDSKKDTFRKTAAKNIKHFLKIRAVLGKKKPKVTLRFIEKRENFRYLDAPKTKWRDMADKIEIRPYHNWCGYFSRPYAIVQKRTPCLNLWNTLAINCNGDVSICSLDYAREGIIGNVRKSSLKHIWAEKELKLYRKKHLYNNFKNLTPCAECAEWRYNSEFWTSENLKKAESYLYKP